MKKLYIQPNMQLQSMHTTSLVCASGGRVSSLSVSGADLDISLTPAGPGLDPM